MTETLQAINKRLLERYGTTVEGKQRYRLVFANTEFETRKSTFRDYYGKLILLREITEVRTVPKYPDFQGLYVLEQFIGDNPSEDIFNYNGYEPIWAFKDNNGNPLDPIWFAIEFIIKRLETRVKAIPESEEEIIEKERLADEQDYKRMMSYLENTNG